MVGCRHLRRWPCRLGLAKTGPLIGRRDARNRPQEGLRLLPRDLGYRFKRALRGSHSGWASKALLTSQLPMNGITQSAVSPYASRNVSSRRTINVPTIGESARHAPVVTTTAPFTPRPLRVPLLCSCQFLKAKKPTVVAMPTPQLVADKRGSVWFLRSKGPASAVWQNSAKAASTKSARVISIDLAHFPSGLI